jgi:hypothetical protein
MAKENKKMKDSVSHEVEKVSLELEGRKVVLTASLVSILIVLSIFNQNIFSPAKSTPVQQDRGIACDPASGLCPELAPLNTEWEYKLAKQMAQNDTQGERDLSSIGQLPSPIEQFRFGLLENKYRFNFDDGKISSIQFPDESPDRPKYITEREEFLKSHAALFSVPFKSIKLALKENSGENVKETFNLLDGENKTTGKAVIVTDQYGRLISVDIAR